MRGPRHTDGTGFLEKDGRTQWVKVDEITTRLSDPTRRAEASAPLGGDEALIELDSTHQEHGRVPGPSGEGRIDPRGWSDTFIRRSGRPTRSFRRQIRVADCRSGSAWGTWIRVSNRPA